MRKLWSIGGPRWTAAWFSSRVSRRGNPPRIEADDVDISPPEAMAETDVGALAAARDLLGWRSRGRRGRRCVGDACRSGATRIQSLAGEIALRVAPGHTAGLCTLGVSHYPLLSECPRQWHPAGDRRAPSY